MKKNGILTLLFACIPGAGQMYQGYMKRGLSLITMFCLFIIVGSATGLDALVVGCIVVYMYSFFDTFNLRAQIIAENAPADDYLVHINWKDKRMQDFMMDSHKLLGWGLIAFGVWALYDILIADWMTTVLEHFFGYGYAYDIIHGIPNILVGILLVVAGIKLLGLHPAKKADPNEADTLPPYPNEKQ